MLIVGQKEVEDGTVSIRSRDTAKTETMTLDNFTLKSQMKSKIVYKKEPDTQTQSLWICEVSQPSALFFI